MNVGLRLHTSSTSAAPLHSVFPSSAVAEQSPLPLSPLSPRPRRLRKCAAGAHGEACTEASPDEIAEIVPSSNPLASALASALISALDHAVGLIWTLRLIPEKGCDLSTCHAPPGSNQRPPR